MQLPQDYFQTNLALLQRNHPLAWQAVTDYTGPLPGELCLAADGKPNLFFLDKDGERVYFHDPNNTDAELANYYAVVPEDATGIALFVGMGLGYTPRAMIQSHRQLRHLGVFEPEVGLFIRALQALDLSPLLSDERVIIALGEDINVPAVLAPMNRPCNWRISTSCSTSPVFASPQTCIKNSTMPFTNTATPSASAETLLRSAAANLFPIV